MNCYKKYLVITHSADSGWDEKRDYSKIGEARKAAREYLADKYYDEAIIVNTETNGAIAEYRRAV